MPLLKIGHKNVASTIKPHKFCQQYHNIKSEVEVWRELNSKKSATDNIMVSKWPWKCEPSDSLKRTDWPCPGKIFPLLNHIIGLTSYHVYFTYKIVS